MVNSGSLEFLRIKPESITSSVGRVVYDHTEKNQSGTAYPSFEGVSLLLYIPRSVASRKIKVDFYNESISETVLTKDATLKSTENGFDIYYVKTKPNELSVGLYFFDVKISSFTNVYGYKSGQSMIFSAKECFNEKFQLTVFEPKYNAPSVKYGGIIYHIFVDRFSRGGNVPVRDDAILIEDWNSEIPEFPAYPGAFLKNNTFFGGTLYGVIDKLDYLSELGVNTIYLSPIFEAYSNHKYDTGDYSTVDKMFGGDEAFKKLIKEAKKRGIGIVLDGVFNHTGSDSIYFNKSNRYSSIGAYQSTDSEYYDWFDFQNHPDKYTCWWGIEILPRINPNKKSCADFFIGKNGIIRKYAKMGIDGFRLDVADELSDDFIKGIKSALNDHNKDSILYGEVWEDASNKIAYDKRKKYYLGDELDGVMNYPIRVGIIDYIVNKRMDKLCYALTDIFSNMPKRVRDAAMNLLGTHDTERILTKLSGVKADGLTNAQLSVKRLSKRELEVAVRRLKMAYTLIATLPGIPSIYYADEAGMQGYSDPFNRRPYPWGNEDEELVSHYKAVGKIRRENAVYKEGEFKLLEISDKILIFERIENGESYITAVNNSNRDYRLKFEKKATELLSNNANKEFVLKPETALIFKSKASNCIEFN